MPGAVGSVPPRSLGAPPRWVWLAVLSVLAGGIVLSVTRSLGPALVVAALVPFGAAMVDLLGNDRRRCEITLLGSICLAMPGLAIAGLSQPALETGLATSTPDILRPPASSSATASPTPTPVRSEPESTDPASLPTSTVGSRPATPQPQVLVFRSCSALNAVYPHGVARTGAVDLVNGNQVAVVGFAVDSRTYAANSSLDIDGDGIACEG